MPQISRKPPLRLAFAASLTFVAPQGTQNGRQAHLVLKPTHFAFGASALSPILARYKLTHLLLDARCASAPCTSNRPLDTADQPATLLVQVDSHEHHTPSATRGCMSKHVACCMSKHVASLACAHCHDIGCSTERTRQKWLRCPNTGCVDLAVCSLMLAHTSMIPALLQQCLVCLTHCHTGTMALCTLHHLLHRQLRRQHQVVLQVK